MDGVKDARKEGSEPWPPLAIIVVTTSVVRFGNSYRGHIQHVIADIESPFENDENACNILLLETSEEIRWTLSLIHI
jgi:hypothetical protein